MDKTFQGCLQRLLDLKNYSHFNEKEGKKYTQKRGKYFVKEVIDLSFVPISSEHVWECTTAV